MNLSKAISLLESLVEGDFDMIKPKKRAPLKTKLIPREAEVLKALKAAGIKATVKTITDKVYGDSDEKIMLPRGTDVMAVIKAIGGKPHSMSTLGGGQGFHFKGKTFEVTPENEVVAESRLR